MSQLLERMRISPTICGGRPCIRSMRICVSDVRELLAADLTPTQIIEELPDLELADVQAVLAFAAHRIRYAAWVA